MKKLLGYALSGLMALSILVPALSVGHVVHAQQLSADELFGSTTGEDFAASAGLGNADLTSTIANIIRVALSFLGIIAVVIILIGGFKWMTAGGNEDKVKEAKKLMIAGVIGLVIVLSSYAIASFVITNIAGVTSGGVTG